MTNHPFVAPCIMTVSGRYFDYLTPDTSELSVQDIAHGLSHICRFGGHVREFFSVSQHSVLASYLVPEGDALAALFHDAAEAVLGDVPTPLKRLLPDYAAIEARVEAAIFAKLGIGWPLPPSVKQADLVMLATERRDLLPEHPVEWPILVGVQPHPQTIVPLSPKAARVQFLGRYAELTHRRRHGSQPAGTMKVTAA